MEIGFLQILDMVGTIAFALSGCFVAAEKRADIIGFWFLAISAGIGGGTIRDCVLGLTPVFWVQDPTALVVCSVVALTAYWFLMDGPRLRALTLWADAAGLAFFAILGANITLQTGAPWFIAVLLGTLTGVGGGIIRDLLAGIPTLILRKDIYASACVLGIILYVSLLQGWYGFTVGAATSGALAVAFIFGVRALAICFRLEFGGYGQKATLTRRRSDSQ